MFWKCTFLHNFRNCSHQSDFRVYHDKYKTEYRIHSLYGNIHIAGFIANIYISNQLFKDVVVKIWCCLFNPFILSYVYIRTKSQNRCDSCTYRLEIEIWAFYWRLTDLYSITSRGVHVLPVCCCHYIRCLLVGGKVQFNRSCLLFFVSFGKLRMSDQVQFIAWHGIQRRIIWIFCRESEVSG